MFWRKNKIEEEVVLETNEMSLSKNSKQKQRNDKRIVMISKRLTREGLTTEERSSFTRELNRRRAMQQYWENQ